MKAIIVLQCANCTESVEQKANLSIIGPGTFGVEVDACRCGSKTFNVQLMDNSLQSLTPLYEVDNYVE